TGGAWSNAHPVGSPTSWRERTARVDRRCGGAAPWVDREPAVAADGGARAGGAGGRGLTRPPRACVYACGGHVVGNRIRNDSSSSRYAQRHQRFTARGRRSNGPIIAKRTGKNAGGSADRAVGVVTGGSRAVRSHPYQSSQRRSGLQDQ